MLQLERRSFQQHDIPIRLGGRRRRFDRTGLTALGIAAFIHLTAFLLVDIREDVELDFDQQVQVIVEAPGVESDWSADNMLLPEAQISSHTMDSHLLDGGAGPETRFALPESQRRMAKISRREEMGLKHFEQYEESHFVPEKIDLPITNEVEPIAVNVAGPLADVSFRLEGLPRLNKALQENASLKQELLEYWVKVDPQDGRVYWVEPRHKDAAMELEQLASMLLDALEFEQAPESAMQEGIVEFVFSLRQSEKLSTAIENIEDQMVTHVESEQKASNPTAVEVPR